MKKIYQFAIAVIILNSLSCKKEINVVETQPNKINTEEKKIKVNQLPFTPLLDDPDSPGNYYAQWHGTIVKVQDVIWDQVTYPIFKTGVPVQASLYIDPNDGSITQNNPVAGGGTVFVLIPTINTVIDFNKLRTDLGNYETAIENYFNCECGGVPPAIQDYLDLYKSTPSPAVVKFSGKIIRHTNSDTGLAMVETNYYSNQ